VAECVDETAASADFGTLEVQNCQIMFRLHTTQKLLAGIVALSITAAAQSQQVTNQRLFDTVPFIPEHHARRLTQFALEPVLQGRIIFLGNSITEMGDWKRLTGDTTVVNRGIGGDITFGMLSRLSLVTVLKPSKIFLLIGINDIGKDIPAPVIAQNIGRIIDRIRAESPGTKIILQTLLPVNPTVDKFPQHYDKNEKVLEVNNLLRTLAKEKQVPLADLHALFRDNKGLLRAELTGDGLHLDPNGNGYRIWVDHLRSGGWL
jgi:lysophospholipase L1-like esterase